MTTKPRTANHVGKNQTSVKVENTSSILRAIYETSDISRADLVRLTGLTAPTVSRIVSFLVEQGVITESPGKRNGVGRKPVVLHFNGRSRYIVAIDFSWAHVRVAIMDLGGGILDRSEHAIDPRGQAKAEFEIAISAIQESLNRHPGIKIIGIGFAAPGLINSESGTIISIPNFPSIRNLQVRQLLEERFGYPTFVVNDANAEAIAEKFFGQGRDASDFVLVHLGYGIGAGLIVGGRLYTGNFGVSGEIGHTSVDRRHGKWCDCGNRGCLELYAGLRAVLEDVSVRLGRQVQFIELQQLASEGDGKVLEVLKDKGELIGYALVNIVNIVAPQRIILTGQVAALGSPIFEPMKHVISERCFYRVADQISITLSSLAENSTLLGAMTIVLDDFLEDPYSFLNVHAEHHPKKVSRPA
ncbi:MAG: ROK family transcriptional regulator [Candidatus Cryosericum sp.]